MSNWFESLTGLALREPWWLLAAVVPLLFALPWWRGRRAAVRFAPAVLLRSDGDRAVPGLPRTWRVRLHWVPAALQVAAWTLVALALARPVRRIELPRTSAGIDIVVCLDVSSSMALGDMAAQRTRLDVAKAAAAEFVAGRPQDRIGLVRFARFPDLVCPPTLDHGALGHLLEAQALVEHEGSEDATGIGTAVARAVQVLAGSRARERVVVLVTDGEENVAAAGTPDEIGPLQAAQLAAKHGVRVHVIAAGGDGAPGAPPIDTSQVERLAERTGGVFHRARDATAIDDVWRRIAALETVEFSAPRFSFLDRHAAFALVALLLLVAARVLARTAFEVLP